MFWSNVFVWDGAGGDLNTRLTRVYTPTLDLLKRFRMRQATIAVRSEILREIEEAGARSLFTELRDLTVLHQVEIALLQKNDLPPEGVEADLRDEREQLQAVVGEDAIIRGVFAFPEKDPFGLVDTYRKLGLRWVVLDPRNVLGPYVDLLDDTVYELVVPGSVYAYFPDLRATHLLREAKDATSRQFRDHFPSKQNRKCYLVTVLHEHDLLQADTHVWVLLEDLYADPEVRSWRLSTVEELFQKRRRLTPELLPNL